MLFTSYPFLFLLIATFALYYWPLLRKHQLWTVVLASFAFYAYNYPVLLILLLFSISINAFTSYMVHLGKPENRKLYATIGVVTNLGVLAFFKYSPLFSRLFFADTSDIGHFLVTIPLPIGISFFTFHGISLLVDIYKKKNIDQYKQVLESNPGRHWLITALYIAFFPQLIAGPIVKAYGFLPQIREKYLKDIRWEVAFKQLIMGYFLKMVIADNIKDFTFWIEYPYFIGLSSITLFTMLLGYSMQIFADFAGYSLIALGLAELFGYQLPINFNFPYISRTFSEFWTRWHISLSSWLREYLYFPLGGNRKGEIRTYINLMLVMFLGGLWHGAAWSYAIWGSFHGLALAVERFFETKVKVKDTVFVKILRALMVFTFVTFAWLLFKLPNFDHVIKYVLAMMHGGTTNIQIIFHILLYTIPVVIYHLAYVYEQAKGRELIKSSLQPVLYGILLFIIIVNSGTAGDFIYFQF